jgi:hypothetical protein
VQQTLQVHKRSQATRLLLAAPSNWAADLLATRLFEKGLPRSSFIRVCAYNRDRKDLDQALYRPTECSNFDDTGDCDLFLQ